MFNSKKKLIEYLEYMLDLKNSEISRLKSSEDFYKEQYMNSLRRDGVYTMTTMEDCKAAKKQINARIKDLKVKRKLDIMNYETLLNSKDVENEELIFDTYEGAEEFIKDTQEKIANKYIIYNGTSMNAITKVSYRPVNKEKSGVSVGLLLAKSVNKYTVEVTTAYAPINYNLDIEMEGIKN